LKTKRAAALRVVIFMFFYQRLSILKSRFTISFTESVNRFSRLKPTSLALCALIFLCALSPVAVRAQDEEIVRVETNLVQLNIGVADRRGRAITDLTANDFVVYEDDVRQRVVSFEPSARPFSLVLMLDTSGSTLNFRTTLKLAAARFIDALAPEDRIAVVSFNREARTLAGFTTDRRRIYEAINLAEGRGETRLFNALRHSLRELAREGTRRKAIIVMSDGIDTEVRRQDRATTVGLTTEEEAIAALRPTASRELNEVLDAADRLGVTIYPLALPSGNVRRLSVRTPQIVAEYHSARARFEMLAARSGGRLHDITRIEDMGRLYAEVAADMRTLYTLAYQPSGERRRDGRWRAIRIEVTRPDTVARTRLGYFAR
jgi:VWFA-related protein